MLFCTVAGVGTAAPIALGTERDCTITQPKSLEGKMETTIRFVNATSGTVGIYWLNYTGERVLYKQLAAGASYDQPTWNTHPWVALDGSGTCIGYTVAPVAEYRITEDPKPSPALSITRLVVPKAVVGNGRRADLKLFWQGEVEFPVRIQLSKAGCSSKRSCKAARTTIVARKNPLVWKKAWFCRGTVAAYRVATDAWLTDANGQTSPKVKATLTCKAR